MNRYKMIMSIGGNPDDRFKPWMEITEPIHRQYCERHGADFEFFAGEKEPGLHPTWNRIPMFLDAFDAGYEKVAWLDADTLIVDQDRSVFAETDDTVPLLMTRVESSHLDFPWASEVDGAVVSADRWDVYNDGVLIANNTPQARECFDFVWANRRTPFKPWHVPGIPELDWILDFVYAHPESVQVLDETWNCMGYDHGPPIEEAAILAWHGQPHPHRWKGLREGLQRAYGITIGPHPFAGD